MPQEQAKGDGRMLCGVPEVPQAQLGSQWANSGRKLVTRGGGGGLLCGTQFCLRWPLFTVPDPNPLILRPRTPAFPNLDRGTYRVMGVGGGGTYHSLHARWMCRSHCGWAAVL